MSEDITQDPEYRKGYERGIEAYRREQSLEVKGFHAGYNALKTPKTVESKAVPDNSERGWPSLSTLEERIDELEKRLNKLEWYTEE
ncbi:MAG TPA: hypothetical protein VHV10_16340 [Ktedonobacteraceae bacterium]|jgi:hypothetical protein|nr:hypothetical protein [Ktedonobacteraceae bacterium]